MSLKTAPLLLKSAPFLLACWLDSGLLHGQQPPSSGTKGIGWIGPTGIVQSVSDISKRDSQRKDWVPHSKPALVPEPVAAGLLAASEQHVTTPAHSAPRIFAPQTVTAAATSLTRPCMWF